jgi:hypothetical protein
MALWFKTVLPECFQMIWTGEFPDPEKIKGSDFYGCDI